MTVTDNDGCEEEKTITVGSNSLNCPECDDAPTVSIVSSVLSTCTPSCVGKASFNASGGTGALNYTWNSSPTTNLSFNNLCEGSHIFRAIDVNACFEEKEILINDCNSDNLCSNKNLSIEIQDQQNSSCENKADGQIHIALASNGVLGGDQPFLIKINGDIVSGPSNQFEYIKTNAIAGVNYDFSISDAEGCEVNKEIKIENNDGNCPECDLSLIHI